MQSKEDANLENYLNEIMDALPQEFNLVDSLVYAIEGWYNKDRKGQQLKYIYFCESCNQYRVNLPAHEWRDGDSVCEHCYNNLPEYNGDEDL